MRFQNYSVKLVNSKLIYYFCIYLNLGENSQVEKRKIINVLFLSGLYIL